MTARRAARWGVLALCALAARSASGQAAPSASREPVSGSTLGQNYPNPFAQETTIPFTIGSGPTCDDPGRQHRVSLQVFNVLAQFVATPVLQGGAGGGEPIRNVQLTCGQYTAWWDGKSATSGREAASGVYMYRLEVDGKAVFRKMIVMR